MRDASTVLVYPVICMVSSRLVSWMTRSYKVPSALRTLHPRRIQLLSFPIQQLLVSTSTLDAFVRGLISLTYAVPSLVLHHQGCPSDLDQTHLNMQEVQADSNVDGGSMMAKRKELVPDEVVKVARAHGVWMFKIGFQGATVPSSLLTWHRPDEWPNLGNSKSIRIVWKERWMDDVPENIDGDRYWSLARTLNAIITPKEDVVWLSESSLYAVGAVGENRQGKHLCLEQACLDSLGTQCPRLAVSSISMPLAEQVSAGEEGRAGTFKNAVEYLGTAVQDTCNKYPNDAAKIIAAVIHLALSENPFRQWVRA